VPPHENAGGTRSDSSEDRRSNHAAERTPHLIRIYDLSVRLLEIVEGECSTRVAGEPAARSNPPSESYDQRVAACVPDIDAADAALQVAARERTEQRYAIGMAEGLAWIGVVTVLASIAVAIFDAPFVDVVALPAGAIGAAVSVFQRMTTGTLKLDTNSSQRALRLFGALRAVLGGVFGMALYALIRGGFVAVLDVPQADELPFFAIVGFLAGFNERFVQDMLAGSANSFGATGAAGHAAR